MALVVPAPGRQVTAERDHRPLPRADRRLQGARRGRVPRRDPAHGHRQDPEVQAARAVLGGRGAAGELTRQRR